jgi:hypothetical protein
MGQLSEFEQNLTELRQAQLTASEQSLLDEQVSVVKKQEENLGLESEAKETALRIEKSRREFYDMFEPVFDTVNTAYLNGTGKVTRDGLYGDNVVKTPHLSLNWSDDHLWNRLILTGNDYNSQVILVLPSDDKEGDWNSSSILEEVLELDTKDPDGMNKLQKRIVEALRNGECYFSQPEVSDSPRDDCGY